MPKQTRQEEQQLQGGDPLVTIKCLIGGHLKIDTERKYHI